MYEPLRKAAEISHGQYKARLSNPE